MVQGKACEDQDRYRRHLCAKKKKKKSSVNKHMHVGLGRQLKEAESILAEEDVPIDSSPACSQELPEENFPEVVLLAVLGV